MEENRMDQQSGDYSRNLQIAGNVTLGVSAAEARQIALDVFKANFYDFSEKAVEKAFERAAEMTDKFIEKFFKEIPHLKLKLEEPSIQASMFNAQKEYAKTGDKELEDRLINILIERIKSDERSLKQIALDEALSILPKLTNEQVNVLTLVFSAVYLNHRVNNLPSLLFLLNDKLLNFFPDNINPESLSFFSHLQYSGGFIVLAEGSAYKPLEEIFLSRYKGVFNKGFTEAEFINEVDMNVEKFRPLLIKCLQNPIALQLNALDDNVLNSKIDELNLGEFKGKLNQLFNKTTMTLDEVKSFLIKMNPRSEKLLSHWRSSDFKTVRLTSVGFAIAIMNYNKMTGESIKVETFV